MWSRLSVTVTENHTVAHYVKLFESIIHSTLWSNEPPATRVVWVTMLAMADSEGEVQASIPGLAKAAGVTLAECEQALDCFLSPDPYSRSKEAGGRRIQEIRGGWELINYKHYRHLKSVEQERENAAERQQRARERRRAVTAVTESHRESPHIEEEEEVEEGSKEKRVCPEPQAAPDSPILFKVPCSGLKQKEWPLTQAKLDEWVEAFPGIDVKYELRKAIQWIKDNPTKRKTFKGLPAFFGRWLSSAQDRGGGVKVQSKSPTYRARADAEYREINSKNTQPQETPSVRQGTQGLLKLLS